MKSRTRYFRGGLEPRGLLRSLGSGSLDSSVGATTYRFIGVDLLTRLGPANLRI